MTRAQHPALVSLLRTTAPGPAASVGSILQRFPARLVALAAEQRCAVRVLEPGQAYRDASPALARLGIDVDAWPAPPAGLFVVEERALYLRSLSPMTVAHEFGHAVDCALGSGVYYSGVTPAVRAAFAEARSFVTPYAATGLDEYFAESLRAYVGVNDPASPWPKALRERLRRVDPAMHDLLAAIVKGGDSA